MAKLIAGAAFRRLGIDHRRHWRGMHGHRDRLGRRGAVHVLCAAAGDGLPKARNSLAEARVGVAPGIFQLIEPLRRIGSIS